MIALLVPVGALHVDHLCLAVSAESGYVGGRLGRQWVVLGWALSLSHIDKGTEHVGRWLWYVIELFVSVKRVIERRRVVLL